MRKLVLLSILAILLFACSREKRNFTVEIKVDGAGNEMIYLAQRTLTGTVVVDSAVPDKSGKYVVKGYTKQPDFYVLYHIPRNYINLIIHPGDDFKVLTNAAEFDLNYLIEGSKDSRLIQKMVNMQRRTLEKITEISERFEKAQGSPDFGKIKTEIDSTYERIFSEHKQFSIQIIRDNPESLATLMALYQQLGRNTPVFDYKKDLSWYETVDSNLSKVYPNSQAVIDLDRKVHELRDVVKFEPGSPAPDLSLPDSTGTLRKLSSLRGKKVLLVFWASWSSRSVALLQELTALTKNSAGRVELYQVSLDKTRESWLSRVNMMNSTGIHVSDLKYWDSPVVETYHILKLPVIYLLDENGDIVSKDSDLKLLPDLIK
jgi:hypothetical protein